MKKFKLDSKGKDQEKLIITFVFIRRKTVCIASVVANQMNSTCLLSDLINTNTYIIKYINLTDS